VWSIDGDGCFQMTNQELATCAIEGIPIKVALINNSSLGMVRAVADAVLQPAVLQHGPAA
jgi:thiamine pyrophosphate-dependent acetolactate synthase large subunit-like protein